MKRRTEITIKTDRILVIRKRGGAVLMWCDDCGEQVKMLTPEEAAVLPRVSSRAIYRWVEAGDIHFAETADGQLFICLNSLS